MSSVVDVAICDALPAEFLDGPSIDDRERGWDDWLTPGQARAGTVVAEERNSSARSAMTGPTLWVMASTTGAGASNEHAGWSWDGTTSEHRFDCAKVPIVRYGAEL